MKQDKDLVFLATCQNEDLRTLCDFLIYNKKGELRMSEQLSNSDAFPIVTGTGTQVWFLGMTAAMTQAPMTQAESVPMATAPGASVPMAAII